MKIFGYQPGLQSKIMAALTLVGLLPLGFVTYRLISLNRSAFTEQVLRVHALAAQTTASQAETYIQSLHTLAKSAAINPTLYLDPTSPQARQLQADLLASGPVELVAIVSLNNESQELLRAQKRGRDDLVDHLLPLGVPGGVQLAHYQNLPMLILSAEFPDGGDLRVIASAKALSEMVDPTELGKGAVLVITDPEGKPLLANQSGIQIPTELMAMGTSLKVSGSGKYKMPDESTVLGSYSPLQSVPWIVISWQPVTIAEAIARTMQRRAAEAFGLALLITALLGTLAYLSVVRPIRALIRGYSGWQQGSGDEIKQLQQAFSILGKQDDEPGDIEKVFLGRYQVIRKVGQGGMGAVFHGWDPKLQRPIALKTLLLNDKRPDQDTHQLIAKLLKEATTAANLNHANIVSVYDVKDIDQYAYVAMEFVDGCSFSEYLDEHGPLEPSQAIALFAEVAKGLAAAHEKGIVHRDIKPANILLGEDHSVKIADFGISQLLTSLEDKKEKVAGTPGFLSPEILNGGAFAQSADLFALGVTMYRALVGVYPFAGATVKGVLVQTIHKNPTPPHILDPKIPKPLNDLVMALLAKDPANRLSNAKMLIYGLEAMLRGERWVFQPVTKPGVEKQPTATLLEEIQYVDTSADLANSFGT